MSKNIDNRQLEHRGSIVQLSTSALTTERNIVTAINTEVTPPFRMRQDTGSNRVLFVDDYVVTNSGTSRKKIINPIEGVHPTITFPFSITFPSAPAGTVTSSITITSGATTPSWTSTHYIKVGIAVNSLGQLDLTYGIAAATIDAATPPELVDGAVNIGYIVLQNNAGTISNVTNSIIYQYAASGSGSGGGSGSGTFKNYLQNWFSGERNISGVADGGVSATGNRTAGDALWASTSLSNITIERSNTVILRGKYSIKVDVLNGSLSGANFVESPVFNLDVAELRTTIAPLQISFSADLSGSGDIDAVLVRYNSSGTYLATLPVVGPLNVSGATPNSQLVSDANKYYGIISMGAGFSATDKFALRIRSVSSSIVTLYLEDLYVGPNSDISATPQRFAGDKQFADGLEAREGIDVPLNLDFTTTLTIPANETKIVGKLDIASGTTINVSTSSSNLLTVGAITGPGSLVGPGVVTSI